MYTIRSGFRFLWAKILSMHEKIPKDSFKTYIADYITIENQIKVLSKTVFSEFSMNFPLHFFRIYVKLTLVLQGNHTMVVYRSPKPFMGVRIPLPLLKNPGVCPGFLFFLYTIISYLTYAALTKVSFLILLYLSFPYQMLY